MKEHDAVLSELDYEQLPPALRRKYFSSLERLRLAQDGACPIYPSRSPREPQWPLTSSNASSFPSKRSVRRPSTTLDDCLVTSSPSVRNRLRKHSRILSVSPQQVAHFASLPPVLQRKQFSREEQVLLASRLNHVILDAADEVLYKQYGPRSRPGTGHKDLPLDDPDLDDSEYEDMEFSEDDIESMRWLDEEEDLDLSLYDYHAALAETTQKTSTLTRRTSLRRGLFASTASVSRRTSSIHSISTQAGWPLPNPSSSQIPTKLLQSIHAPNNIHNHRKNRASTSSLEPSATHYQDPAARMKLRVYLASPQKFDEAIEFGFPSMQDSSMKRVAHATTTPRTTESISQVLVHDDTPSLSDGDDQEVDGLDSPRTPDVPTFTSSLSRSKDTSLDRTSFKPKVIREYPDPYVHALASNREMTLHMTLTRPDLRSPDELSATRDINTQPLEHEQLHFSDDNAAFWDTLPDNESKMKKLFKRFKLKP